MFFLFKEHKLHERYSSCLILLLQLAGSGGHPPHLIRVVGKLRGPAVSVDADQAVGWRQRQVEADPILHLHVHLLLEDARLLFVHAALPVFQRTQPGNTLLRL